MAEENNDKIPGDPGKKLPLPLEKQLRTLLPGKEMDLFTEQLPDAFLADATEGLSQVRDSPQLDTLLKHLNHQMHQQLTQKKKRLGRRRPGDLSWTYWAILVILLLTICAFLVIRIFLLHH
jgi:hypothetical protein